MGKLSQRYSPQEKARLTALLKPAEYWSATERRQWERSPSGFRHFIASNIVALEHYRPEPTGIFTELHGRTDPPSRTRRTTTPPRKPAA
jgi:hypothetical protein